MGVEGDDGEIETVLYPCRRCSREDSPAPPHAHGNERQGEHHISAAGDPFAGIVPRGEGVIAM